MACTREYICGKDFAKFRVPFALSAAALIVLCLTLPARAETVLTRKRVGNNSEGVTYVTTGHWKNRVVAIDGNDVLSINLGGPGDDSNDSAESGGLSQSGALRGPGWRKIFDVLPLGAGAVAPKGILFLPGRNEFVFGGFVTTTLFHTDQFGNPLAPIVLTGLANPTDFTQYEGLTWIPADAPEHPNTIAALMIRASDFLAHLIYIQPDGTVQAEVLPQPGTPIESYMCGIAYQAQRPGTLLISECAGGNYAMDQDGNFLGGPILPAPAGSGDIESIFVDRFSRVFLGGYDGHLYAYDSNYNRLPTVQNHSYVIGLGIGAAGVTWNAAAQRLLLLDATHDAIDSVPLSLRSKRLLFNLDPVRADSAFSISDLGGGQLAIANRFFPRGIQVVNLSDGSEVERLIFLPPDYPAGRAFQPVGVSGFGPDQFLVRVIDDRGSLKVISRTGTPDSSVLPNALLPTQFPDLTLGSLAVGRSVQLFDAGSGPSIFTAGSIFDISGNLLYTVDQNVLGATLGFDQGTWINGNMFADVEPGTSTVVVFSVP
jgi:hypothetical protein